MLTTSARKVALVIVAAALVGILAPSCGPSTSQMYTAANPASVAPCGMPAAGQDAPTRSYAAMMKALAELKWRFDEIAPQQGRLKATACLGAGTECVPMIFSVASDGGITVLTDPAAMVSDEMDGHLIRWMRNFDQRFSTYRCMAKDVALEELKKFGAVQ